MSEPEETGAPHGVRLQAATDRHRAGDLAEARRLYAEALALAPNDALALFRFGLLELQERRPDAALALIAQALAAEPTEMRYQFGLAQALQALGRWHESAEVLRRILRQAPESADAHFGLGVALQSQGDHHLAIASFERTLELRPDFSEALNNLGMSRQLTGQPAQAAAAYAAALALRPQDATCLGNLGAVLREMGDLDQAVVLLRRAVRADSRNAANCINLAIALCQRREHAEAESILRETLALHPKNAEAAFNLGNALDGLGRNAEAIEQYRLALSLRPGFPEAWNNLGNVLKKGGDFASAMTAYESAIASRPDDVVALNNLGCLLRTLGRSGDAEAVLRRGLQLDARNSSLHDNLGSVLKDAGALDEAIECFRKSLELDPGSAPTHGNLAYALSFQSLQAGPILEECRRWNERFAAPLARSSHRNRRDAGADRPMRIGYVSADFRDHCQSLFTLPLLANHDHSRFEVFCYSSVERPDAFTRRVAGYADAWRDVRSTADEGLCELIRADGIDILVDLSMHMAGNRLLAFARRPAPVQICWLAYPGTTGMAAMDYRLSDPRLDPEHFETHYSERTLRLADSFWCYDPLTAIPVGPLPALERGYLTLGCLNNPCKLTDRTLQLWGGVMQALTDARLLVMAPAGRHRRRMLERFAAHGIGAQRIDFVGFRPRADYLRTYRYIDLGLDTFPYNGHTTSLDSLWMGVPLISRVGDTSVGRGGLSQLYHLDLLELAAETDAAFIAKAVALGTDLPGLAALRQELRARMEASPLMDAKRFARSMEAAYGQAWAAHCSGA